VRILIAGALGQLGSDLALLCPAASTHDIDDMPIDDEAAIRRVFAEDRPELVFNCAAYNAVDRAETDPQEAIAANAVGPRLLAKVCASLDIRFVHYSTNYVFDGCLDRPYLESDQPKPLSVYGRTKLDGERSVMALMPGALVIRVAGLFGQRGSAIKGGSFPDRILKKAASNEALHVVADQRLNPTYTHDLALASMELVKSGMTGLVHLVPHDTASWYEFAAEILTQSGVRAEIHAVSTEELTATARRPTNGCLQSTRVAPLRSWKLALRDFLSARGLGSAASASSALKAV